MHRPLITAADVEGSRNPTVPPGAILTPLARDLLRARGVTPRSATGAPTRQLVIANWKSHKTVSEALSFAAELAELRRNGRPAATCVVCAPYTALYPLGRALGGVAELGAQDLSPHGEGAHTGEVAARHLLDVGCRWVIVGHSERRAAGEDDALIRRKLLVALGEGLRPVLCVGETLEERRAGRAEAVVSDQLRAALRDLDTERAQALAVAYEPRWAIGTGLTPKNEEIVTLLAHVRAVLERIAPGDVGAKIPVLYGGSVKVSNAAEILELGGCGGALVGGAALNPADFHAILIAATP